MFTAAPPAPAPHASALTRPARRAPRPPVIHDRWGDDVPQPTPAPAPSVATGVLVREAQCVTLPCAGSGAVAVHLAGRWRGRVRFETSDDGAAWRPIVLNAHATGERAVSARGPGLWCAGKEGAGRYLRLRVIALTAGAAVVCLAAAPVPHMPPSAPSPVLIASPVRDAAHVSLW